MENPSMQQVADELGMDITTFSRQVKSLVGKGLVTRKTSQVDRRVSLLCLTDAGMDVMNKIDSYMETKIELVFSCMTSFEREVVTSSLGLLNEALAKADEETGHNINIACCN